jgi:hypothetical protein
MFDTEGTDCRFARSATDGAQFAFQPTNGSYLSSIPNMKMDKNGVFSFSPDQEVLMQRKAALRDGGFDVFSVDTECRARFD